MLILHRYHTVLYTDAATNGKDSEDEEDQEDNGDNVDEDVDNNVDDNDPEPGQREKIVLIGV